MADQKFSTLPVAATLGAADLLAIAQGGTSKSITGTVLSAFIGTIYLPKAGGTMTGALLFTDNTIDIGAAGATRPRTGYFGTSVVAPLFTGNLTGNVTGTVTGGSSLNVLKAGDTMTGALLFTDNTVDIGAAGATRPRTGYFGTSVVAPLFTGNVTGNVTGTVTGAASLNLLLTGGTLTGALLFTDNTLDIGAAGATRPRTGYFGTSVVAPTFTGNLTGTVTGAASLNLLLTGGALTGVTTLTTTQTDIAGNSRTLEINPTFSPAAGSANFRALSIAYTINASGAQSGSATGLVIVGTETALNGITHSLVTLVTGADTHFRILANGNVGIGSGVATTDFGSTSAGSLMLKASTAPTADPATNCAQIWSSSGALAYRVASSLEGAGQTNFLHNASLGSYSAGTVYTLTTTNAKITFGTTSPALTISASGTWALHANVKVNVTGATYASGPTLTVLIRRINNTAANLTNSGTTYLFPTMTTLTQTMALFATKEIFYTTANSNDSLELWADITALPSAGSVTIEFASFTAHRLF